MKTSTFIVISVSTILLLPSLLLPWSLIDDGADFLHAQSLLSGNTAGLFEWSVGRIRPAFWLARAVQTAIFGQQVWLHHLARIVMFIVCAWLVFAIARRIAPHSKAALYSAALFAFCPFGWEVWFRLGPQEGYVVLWSLISTYCLLRSVSGSKIAYWIAVVSISLAIFSKEAAVVQGGLALALVWLLCREHPSWHGRIYALVALASSLVMVALVWMLPRQGYNTNYQLTIPAIAANARGYLSAYLPYLLVVIAGVGGMILIPRRDIHKLYWPIYFLAWAVFWLAVQLPWGFTISRYLLPSAVGLSLSIGLLLGQVSTRPLWMRIFVPIGMTVFIVSSLLAYIQFAPDYLYREQTSANIVRMISSQVEEKGVVYTDLPDDDERFIETGMHLRWLYGRGDIRLVPVAQGQFFAIPGWHLATAGNTTYHWQLLR